MDKAKLSRRQILAGLAVTGSSGALVGSGTSALFSDEETFANNTIEASKNVAGVVYLNVGIDDMGDDGICFDISLPESNEQEVGNNEQVVGNNNPSYVWVRVDSCPEPPDVNDDPAISWIAFCGDNITDSDVTLEIRSVDEDGDPTEIYWNVETTGNTSVKFVRWKLGRGAADCGDIQEVNVSDSSSGTIGGCVSDAGSDVDDSTPCPKHGGLKYENDDRNEEQDLPSIPCKSINTFDTDIKLYLKDCPDKPIAEDGVREVLNYLLGGVLLSCDEKDACLQPEDKRTLCIERTESTCELDEITFELLFYGQQCRYSSGSENPFDEEFEC